MCVRALFFSSGIATTNRYAQNGNFIIETESGVGKEFFFSLFASVIEKLAFVNATKKRRKKKCSNTVIISVAMQQSVDITIIKGQFQSVNI